MLDTTLRVLPKFYGGSDPKKQQKYREASAAGKQIEKYIKEMMATKYAYRTHVVFVYFNIANELHLDEDLVKKLLRPVGGGGSGITVVRPKPEEDD